MGQVTIGIDIGQMHERSAIAVVETATRRPGERGEREDGDSSRLEVYHTVRFLERLPVGTTAPALAARLKGIVTGVRDYHMGYTIFADATAIGQPIIDVLVHQAGVRLTPVYTTWGDRRVVAEEGYVTLGKAHLVSQLQALLQTGCLLLPSSDEARVLAKELLDYEITMTEQANDTYGAFVVGTKDELVTALGLAVQAQPAAVSGWHPGVSTATPWARAWSARHGPRRRVAYQERP